ncbi:hypothetical protein FACS1894125_7300 [Actinomycetota bacterium]|nr:hypothetical protein FACS1894125_7300 [Actinomycetota bacterium]
MLQIKKYIKGLNVQQKIALIVTLILLLLAIIFVPSIVSFERLKAQDEKAHNSKEMTLDEITDFLSEEFPDLFDGCIKVPRVKNSCGIFSPYIDGTDDGIYNINVFDYGNFATDEYLWDNQFRILHSDGVNEEKTIMLFGYNWMITGVPDAIYAVAEKLDGLVVDNSCTDNIFCRIADNTKTINGWKWRPNGEKWPSWDEKISGGDKYKR